MAGPPPHNCGIASIGFWRIHCACNIVLMLVSAAAAPERFWPVLLQRNRFEVLRARPNSGHGINMMALHVSRYQLYSTDLSEIVRFAQPEKCKIVFICCSDWVFNAGYGCSVLRSPGEILTNFLLTSNQRCQTPTNFQHSIQYSIIALHCLHVPPPGVFCNSITP